jgi:HlyD family secretion protein
LLYALTGSSEEIMKFSKWYLLGFGIIIVAVVGFYAVKNGKSNEVPESAVRYKEYVIKRGTFRNTVTANGTVIPIDRVEIKSKASGLIEDLPVEEGDYVKKGALICRLDQTDVQAEVDQAQANYDIAEAELKQAQNTYNRQQQLYSKQLLSDEELDQIDLTLAQARGKMVSARIALDQAKNRFDETIVRAPISGIILQKYVEIGQIISSGISNVSGGTPISDIADMDSVYIEAGIDEIDVGKIHIGQSADVIADAYPDLTFSGNIVRIAPEARIVQNVTLFDVVIIVGNKDLILKSGMNAKVEITIAQKDNALLVPVLTLEQPRRPNSPADVREVMLKKGDRFESQQIRIGLFDFETAVVEEGLKDGDVVGVPMLSRLKEDNDRMEERLRNSRQFGTSGSR